MLDSDEDSSKSEQPRANSSFIQSNTAVTRPNIPGNLSNPQPFPVDTTPTTVARPSL